MDGQDLIEADDDDRPKMRACEHFWVSKHQPDFPPPIYWVVVCDLCGDIDGSNLAEQIASSVRVEADDAIAMEQRYRLAMEAAWDGDLRPISELGNEHEALVRALGAAVRRADAAEAALDLLRKAHQ